MDYKLNRYLKKFERDAGYESKKRQAIFTLFLKIGAGALNKNGIVPFIMS
jgi:hypothetical protein